MTAEKFHNLMAVDKKVLDGVLRLVLMKGIGQSVLTDNYSPDELTKTIEASLAA
jgi:3-dehydroquinate synthase